MSSFKEGKGALIHVHKFVNALLLNDETDDSIIFALFGKSLVDATNYNGFSNFQDPYPNHSFSQLIAAFKLWYHKVHTNNHAYFLFRRINQEAQESVDDFHERMMKLAKQFTILPTDSFFLSNFRAGLLLYSEVATVGLP